MEDYKIVGLAIIGALWFMGVVFYIYSWIKTRTCPFQLSDSELIDKVFNKKKR